MKRCARCGEEKPESEFGFKRKDRKWLVSYCRSCVRERSKEHYAANRRRYMVRARRRDQRERMNRTYLIVEYLQAHPCVDCGETDPLVLEFDHMRDKSFNIGHELTSRAWADILAEIEKCEVRCANCHRRRTAERAGFLRLTLPAEP
jgi:hypothetical protein